MKKWTKQFGLLLVILVVFVAAACSKDSTNSGDGKGTSEGATDGNKTFFLGVNTPPSALNPINALELNTQMLSSILFESLYDLDDATMDFLPKLAESMKTTDNQTFEITLRQGVKWTDGEPFTTKDIKFTLDMMGNPDVVSLGLQEVSNIEGLDDNGFIPAGEKEISGVKIVDDYTLTVTTKAPVDMNFLKENLGVKIRFIPEHILKDVTPSELHTHPFMQNPDVTNGAFKLEKFAKDQYVEFTANKEYYRGAPKLDKLFVKVMPSSNLVAQLQTGEIHMNIPSIAPLSIEDYGRVKNLANVTTTPGEPLDSTLLMMNVKTLQDVKVRQAIAYAIDREVLINKVYQGSAALAEGPLPPNHPYYNASLPSYEYNPEKAKQLLQEAGWDLSKPIQFATSTGNKSREQVVTVIGEQLKSIGLNVQIQKYDFPTLLQKGAKHEFDLLIIGSPFFLDPDRSIFFKSDGSYNFSQYNNPAVDQLLAQGKAEPDPEKRHAIYDEIITTTQEELPIFTLYVEQNMGAVSKSVVNAKPKDYGALYNIHEWDLQ